MIADGVIVDCWNDTCPYTLKEVTRVRVDWDYYSTTFVSHPGRGPEFFQTVKSCTGCGRAGKLVGWKVRVDVDVQANWSKGVTLQPTTIRHRQIDIFVPEECIDRVYTTFRCQKPRI